MNYNNAMKIFRFKFSKLTTIFIYAGIVLALAAFGVTLYNVIKADYIYSNKAIYSIIGFVAMFIVSILLLVILVSLLLSSYYSVGGNELKTSFGIIKSRFKISDIERVILDRTTGKLAAYFKNESYIMIVVKPEWYEDFVNELLKCNPQIEYVINSAKNSPDDQLKK